MPSICIYLQIHQPYRIRKFEQSDISKNLPYFNESKIDNLSNVKILKSVCKKSYFPTNMILLKLLNEYKDFKFTLSFSGIILEQLEKYSPKTLLSFQKLINTGKVEILSETYYHSLSYFYSKKEFEEQVEMHARKIYDIFGIKPKIFRNTELSYNNKLAKWAEINGYRGILAEGWPFYLKKKSPNYLYIPKGTKKIKLLLKNYELSDDIAFRFSERRWPDWPLTAKSFADKLSKLKGDTVNLFMDFETFGEHQWKETGIFNFLKEFPEEFIKLNGIFKTSSETIKSYGAKGKLNISKVLTWADNERDLSAWTGNKIQKIALKNIYSLEKSVLQTKNKILIEDWRKLQTSDHFYYMSTKQLEDGVIHSYFSPYKNPNDAYRYFMNALSDLKIRIKTINKLTTNN